MSFFYILRYSNINLLPTSSISIHLFMEAEVKMILMLVYHNVFFNLFDHQTQYIKGDSEVAELQKNLVIVEPRLQQ